MGARAEVNGAAGETGRDRTEEAEEEEGAEGAEGQGTKEPRGGENRTRTAQRERECV